jgi:hypothetical protein
MTTSIIKNVKPQDRSPAAVAREFRRLAEACGLRVDGTARLNPLSLLHSGYTPKHRIDLFDTVFFLCNKRDVDGLKVMPAYVLSGEQLFARVFYKDSSLVWRSASHYINTPGEQWIGKGAVKFVSKRGESAWVSAEETTNLPFEMQAALDEISRRGPRARNDRRVLDLLLRAAPLDRVHPYRDFEAPREAAMRKRSNRINGLKPVAWFEDDNRPESLKFAPGFAPDFKNIIDSSESRSTMYGGKIRKVRIASRNRLIQYLFVGGATHVWIVHPQSFTTELSSYGVRTVDVNADEELFIPGYEFYDEYSEGGLHDQIPPGFAGPICPLDPDRADASPWNDRLSVIRRFRQLRL